MPTNECVICAEKATQWFKTETSKVPSCGEHGERVKKQLEKSHIKIVG